MAFSFVVIRCCCCLSLIPTNPAKLICFIKKNNKNPMPIDEITVLSRVPYLTSIHFIFHFSLSLSPFIFNSQLLHRSISNRYCATLNMNFLCFTSKAAAIAARVSALSEWKHKNCRTNFFFIWNLWKIITTTITTATTTSSSLEDRERRFSCSTKKA